MHSAGDLVEKYSVIEQAQTIREDIFNILRVLSSKDDLTQRELSNHLDFSLGKTNYLLKILIQSEKVLTISECSLKIEL